MAAAPPKTTLPTAPLKKPLRPPSLSIPTTPAEEKLTANAYHTQTTERKIEQPSAGGAPKQSQDVIPAEEIMAAKIPITLNPPAEKRAEKQAEKLAEKPAVKPAEKACESPPENIAGKVLEKQVLKSAEKPLCTTDKPVFNKNTAQKNKVNLGKKKRVKIRKRDQMKENNLLRSDNFTWKVVKLLGSGGFGDVYKVVKENNADKQEYAMKTEMCEGDKRMLRLKVEVCVLGICTNVKNPEKRRHFIDLIDRGKTDKFKFLVMGLVGPSLEDIRKNIVGRNFSKSTSMQAGFQALQAIGDLHDVGYLHRDIKPQNFAIGLGEHEKTIYMLDFGIARKYTIGDTKQVKAPRLHVKFLGTVRFASRACHNGIEQGRKDDLEAWIYMVYDMMDERYGLPWKRLGDRSQVAVYKEKFFRFQFPNCYQIVPTEFKRLVEYINGMTFAEEPDYVYMTHSIKSIAKENHIDMERKLDWIGRSKKEKQESEEDSDDTSEDNKYTGSDDSDETEKQLRTKKPAIRKRVGVDTPKNTTLQKKRTSVSVGH